MLKVIFIAVAILAISSETTAGNVNLTNSKFRLYHDQRLFATSLLNSLEHTERGQNQIFSPHSIYRALLLAYFGANGKTKEELKNVLNLKWAVHDDEVADAYKAEKVARIERFENTDAHLDSVDKVYVATEAELENSIIRLLDDAIEKVDFAVDPEQRRIEINKFVEKVTEGHIKDLLPSGGIQADTKMVLANAAFFKGTWAKKFDKQFTKKQPFNSYGGGPVEMMHINDYFNYGTIDRLKTAFLKLPYQDNHSSIAMHVFLPFSALASGINGLLANFTPSDLEMALTKGQIKKVDVLFPKFEIEHTYTLSKVFEKMGIEHLFGVGGDMSGFSKTTPIKFDDMIHKAKIIVDEGGTTAAAATATKAATGSVLHEVFHCNRPFVFMIHDKVSNEVLFTGVYRGPYVDDNLYKI